jgi:hypothetical protein
MARKTRTPAPPRRVQAPQQRAQSSPQERRARLLLLVFAGLGIVGVIAAVSVFAFGGSGGSSGARAIERLRSAGCTFRTVKSPKHAGDHSDVPTLTTKVTWNTDPPSNGMHYGQTAIWDFYDEPVNPRLLVHNQEHGGMVIWWGNKVPASTVAKLREFYNQDPVSIVGSPYPKLGSKIALTAWTGNPATYFKNGDYGEGRIAICPAFSEGAFKAFRDAYRGKGPEGVPMQRNQPGT